MTAPVLPFPDTQENPMPKQTPTNIQIGSSLRALRKAAGLTQEELADRLHERGVDIHHSSVSTTELGKRPLTFPEALAIADALDVHLDCLVDYERIETERQAAALREQLAAVEARLAELGAA
jgi:transcriptional regulator with XRE-family HTH domain